MEERQTDRVADSGRSGLKYDDGKAPMGLLPWQALTEVARVLGFGAKKYRANSWQHVRPGSRYMDAALRHIAAYLDGETLDEESGLHVLAHAACDVLFSLWLDMNGTSCRHEPTNPTPRQTRQTVTVQLTQTLRKAIQGMHFVPALQPASELKPALPDELIGDPLNLLEFQILAAEGDGTETIQKDADDIDLPADVANLLWRAGVPVGTVGGLFNMIRERYASQT